jgi:hypothetical protein
VGPLRLTTPSASESNLAAYELFPDRTEYSALKRLRIAAGESRGPSPGTLQPPNPGRTSALPNATAGIRRIEKAAGQYPTASRAQNCLVCKL